MEENKTAVGWLISKLPLRYKNAIMNDCKEEIEQAKEMEKVQIIKAYKKESAYMKHAGCTDEQINESAKKYYNEIYKK